MPPFLPGLVGSDGASLTSEETLSRRSPLFRCGNLTLRRVLDIVNRKEGGERGQERGQCKEGVQLEVEGSRGEGESGQLGLRWGLRGNNK